MKRKRCNDAAQFAPMRRIAGDRRAAEPFATPAAMRAQPLAHVLVVPGQAQLCEVAGCLDAAVRHADALLCGHRLRDEAPLRSLRNELARAREQAAAGGAAAAKLVDLLCDVANEWSGLTPNARELSFHERRQRSLVFTSILRASDLLRSPNSVRNGAAHSS